MSDPVVHHTHTAQAPAPTSFSPGIRPSATSSPAPAPASRNPVVALEQARKDAASQTAEKFDVLVKAGAQSAAEKRANAIKYGNGYTNKLIGILNNFVQFYGTESHLVVLDDREKVMVCKGLVVFLWKVLPVKHHYIFC